MHSCGHGSDLIVERRTHTLLFRHNSFLVVVALCSILLCAVATSAIANTQLPVPVAQQSIAPQPQVTTFAQAADAAAVAAHADAGSTKQQGALTGWSLAIAENLLAIVIWISTLTVIVIGFAVYMRSQPPRPLKPPEVSDKDLEKVRISYGFWLIIAGLILILAVVVITVTAFKNAVITNFSDVIAIVTSITGVVGTLTAAFFGVQAAGAGRSQAISALNDQVKSGGDGRGGGAYKIEPGVGPHAGNTNISISGSGMTGATAVNFGTVPGVNFVFFNDGLVRVTSPAVPLNKTSTSTNKDDVVLTVVTGSKNQVVGTFYYYTLETVLDENNELAFNLYGSGLTGATAIQFGDAKPVPVEGKDPNKIQIKAAQIPESVLHKDVEVAVIFASDSPTKRFVVGRAQFPPAPPTVPDKMPESGDQAKQVSGTSEVAG